MNAQPDSAAVVRSFLAALEARDADAAVALLAEDAVWINVSLPAVRGRERIARIARAGLRLGVGFRVHVHHLAVEGDDVVITERTDELAYGPVVHRFWVIGRFEVRDGRIAVWRDAFDWADTTVGLVRGVTGVVAPGLNRPFPGRH